MQAGQTPQTLNLAREPVLAKILCKHRQKNRGENRRRQKNGVASPEDVGQGRAAGRQKAQQQHQPHAAPRETPRAAAKGSGSRDWLWLALDHDEMIVSHILRRSQIARENFLLPTKTCTSCGITCVHGSFAHRNPGGTLGECFGVDLRRFGGIEGELRLKSAPWNGGNEKSRNVCGSVSR